jgi:valyl-tRNA synthetase
MFVEVGALLDIDKELERINNELASIEKELSRVNAKLGNEQFVNKAPADIVEKEKRIQAELSDKKTKLEERAQSLKS